MTHKEERKMPTLNSYLHQESEVPLIAMIKGAQTKEAAKYIMRHPIERYHETSLQYNGLGEESLIFYQEISNYYIKINGDSRQLLFFKIKPRDPNAVIPKLMESDSIFAQVARTWKSPIHYAAEKGMLDIVRFLIFKAKKCGFHDYVNIKDGYGRTPLHYAAMKGDENLMRVLIEYGADTEIKANYGIAEPWRMMPTDKKYDPRLLRDIIMPTKTTLATKENPLFKAIEKDDEEDVKSYIFNFSLYKDFEIFIAESKKNHNEKLTNLLQFCFELKDCIEKYYVQIYNKPKDEKKIIIDLLGIILKYNQDKSHQEYNYKVIKYSLSVLSTMILEGIKYDYRKKSYEIIPWQHLEFLSSAFKFSEKKEGFDEFCKENISEIVKSISTLKGSLEKLDIDGKIIAEYKASDGFMIEGLEGIYSITSPLMDLRSLKEITKFFDLINEIDVSKPSSKERIALIAIIKQVGEFMKYSEQSANISPIIKKYFPKEMPWRIGEELRDFIAKAPTRPSISAIYNDLLKSSDKSRLLSLRADISDVMLQFKKIEEELEKKSYTELATPYILDFDYKNPAEMSHEQVRDLFKDIESEIESTQKKNHKRRKMGVYIKIKEFFCQEKRDERELDLVQAEILNKFFRDDVNKQKKWRDIFHNKTGQFSALESLYDDFKSAKKGAAGQKYEERALEVIDEILEIMIPDKEIRRKLKERKSIVELNVIDQGQVLQFCKTYEESLISQISCEHLYAEYFQLANKFQSISQLNEDKSKMRNFFEHKSSAYQASDVPINRGNFYEILETLFVHGKELETEFSTPPSPQPRSPRVVDGIAGYMPSFLFK